MQGDSKQPDWLTLDNAARIYPASISDWSPDVYRVSASLHAPIRISLLEEALRTVMPRFPYFQVHLRRGLFWYYLQRNDVIPALQRLSAVPLSILPAHKGPIYLLRVMAKGATIAVDFSHILTDGAGAMRFLGTLTSQYLKLRGVPISAWEPFFDPQASPSAGEYEDAYAQYFERGLPWPPTLSAARHLPQAAQPLSRVITGRLPVTDMLQLARSRGVRLTEYLVALYLHSLADVCAANKMERCVEENGILRIEVPVDMRRFYPSETMRNFSLFVSPEIDTSRGSYSFDEIVRIVHRSMDAQLDRRELSRQITRNVGAAHHPLIRIMPLALKNLVFSRLRERIGERSFSGVLSNLGRIEVPRDIEPHVASFGVMLGPNPLMKTNCTVLSFRNDLCINFGSVIESRELERHFFTHLAREGIPVSVVERSSAP